MLLLLLLDDYYTATSATATSANATSATAAAPAATAAVDDHARFGMKESPFITKEHI